MERFAFLLDVSNAEFFGTLAYAAFYGLTLLAGAVLLLVLVRFKAQAKALGAVAGWLTAVCAAGLAGEAWWRGTHPGAVPTYWRHGAALVLGLVLYLLFRLDYRRLNKGQ